MNRQGLWLRGAVTALIGLDFGSVLISGIADNYTALIITGSAGLAITAGLARLLINDWRLDKLKTGQIANNKMRIAEMYEQIAAMQERPAKRPGE